jgi:uncharacterized protein RhaS with RHS repeats
MARIYAGNDGQIIRWDNTDEIRAAPVGATRMVDYDANYNAAVTALLSGPHTNLRVPANQQLTNGGSPVTINPGSQDYEDWRDLDQLADDLRAYYQLGSPTNAQSVAAIKAIIRVLRLIVRRLWGRGV